MAAGPRCIRRLHGSRCSTPLGSCNRHHAAHHAHDFEAFVFGQPVGETKQMDDWIGGCWFLGSGLGGLANGVGDDIRWNETTHLSTPIGDLINTIPVPQPFLLSRFGRSANQANARAASPILRASRWRQEPRAGRRSLRGRLVSPFLFGFCGNRQSARRARMGA